jgi:hypothetical protein
MAGDEESKVITSDKFYKGGPNSKNLAVVEEPLLEKFGRLIGTPFWSNEITGKNLAEIKQMGGIDAQEVAMATKFYDEQTVNFRSISGSMTEYNDAVEEYNVAVGGSANDNSLFKLDKEFIGTYEYSKFTPSRNWSSDKVIDDALDQTTRFTDVGVVAIDKLLAAARYLSILVISDRFSWIDGWLWQKPTAFGSKMNDNNSSFDIKMVVPHKEIISGTYYTPLSSAPARKLSTVPAELPPLLEAIYNPYKKIVDALESIAAAYAAFAASKEKLAADADKALEKLSKKTDGPHRDRRRQRRNRPHPHRNGGYKRCQSPR